MGGHFVAALARRGGFLELAHQPVEIAQLVYQLSDAVHGVLAADAGVIGQGLDAEHVAIDIGGNVGLLLHGLGYLAAAGGKLIVKTLRAVHSSRSLLYTYNLLCQGGQQINI